MEGDGGGGGGGGVGRRDRETMARYGGERGNRVRDGEKERDRQTDRRARSAT